MMQFESSVKQVPFSQERVYAKLSDLSRLEQARDRLDGKVEGLELTADAVSFTVRGVRVDLRVAGREPCKCVKFEGGQSPVPMNLWIQILPVEAERAKLKVTVRVDVTPFMRAMVSKPLQEGVEKIADMLAAIPY